MALGARVAQARKLRGLSQSALAEAVGTKQASISALERRDSEHSALVWELHEALNVRLNWLRKGDGPMEPEHKRTDRPEVNVLEISLPQVVADDLAAIAHIYGMSRQELAAQILNEYAHNEMHRMARATSPHGEEPYQISGEA